MFYYDKLYLGQGNILGNDIYFDTIFNYSLVLDDSYFLFNILSEYKYNKYMRYYIFNKGKDEYNYLSNLITNFGNKIFIMWHYMEEVDVTKNEDVKKNIDITNKTFFIGTFSLWILAQDVDQLKKLIDVNKCFIIFNEEQLNKLKHCIIHSTNETIYLLTNKRAICLYNNEYFTNNNKFVNTFFSNKFIDLLLEESFLRLSYKKKYKRMQKKDKQPSDWELIPFYTVMSNIFHTKNIPQNELMIIIDNFLFYLGLKTLADINLQTEEELVLWLNNVKKILLYDEKENIYFLFKIKKNQKNSLDSILNIDIDYTLVICDSNKEVIIKKLLKINFDLNKICIMALNDKEWNLKLINNNVADLASICWCHASFPQNMYDPFFLITFSKISNNS